MVPPAAGQVILVPFPFADLSQTKLRPAIILASAGRGDWILCQVTSRPYADTRAIQLEDPSFVDGSLRVTSYARPGKLFTASHALIALYVGTLKADPFGQIIESVVNLCGPMLRLEPSRSPDESAKLN